MNKRRFNTALLLVGVGLALGSLAGAPAQANPTRQPATGPQTNYHAYFPFVPKDFPPVLFGRVTLAGAPAAAVAIELCLYSGSTWTIAATASTDENGVYRFFSPASLGAGQKYLAAFNNSAQAQDRLAWWTTKELASYDGVSTTQLGNFDIARVQLDQPGPGASVGLPAAFHWWHRAASATDSYAVRLYDAGDFNPLFVSASLGYVENFSLAAIPSGLSADTAYAWDVLVRSPDGGQGATGQTPGVRLMPGLFGRVTQSGGAAGGVSVQLRYFNGTTWSTRASTTSSDAGTYFFASVPSLAAGQQYYVRYENVSQTPGRLSLWGTASLLSYTTGTCVDLGSFDIADVPLVNPPASATIGLPYTFQWTRRPATTGDSYLLEVYAPDDFLPRWLSSLVGYAEGYNLAGLPAPFALSTTYAWDVIVVSPNGGSGVSRMARLVTFSSRGTSLQTNVSTAVPFAEALPARHESSFNSGQ